MRPTRLVDGSTPGFKRIENKKVIWNIFNRNTAGDLTLRALKRDQYY